MKKSQFTTILLIGSVWGFLEATLGGLLHLSPLPIAGKIMTPIGFALLFWGLKNGLKASELALVGFIAATLKFSDAFLLGMPLFHIKIINPAQCIALQGLCFAMLTKLINKPLSNFSKIGLGALILYPASFGFSALFSQLVLNYPLGSLAQGILPAILNTSIGTFLTFIALSLTHIGFQKTPVFQIARLSPLTRNFTAVVLITASLVIRGFIG